MQCNVERYTHKIYNILRNINIGLIMSGGIKTTPLPDDKKVRV